MDKNSTFVKMAIYMYVAFDIDYHRQNGYGKSVSMCIS